jgi:hypothetical protein
MILQQQSLDPCEDPQAPSFRFVPPTQSATWPAVWPTPGFVKAGTGRHRQPAGSKPAPSTEAVLAFGPTQLHASRVVVTVVSVSADRFGCATPGEAPHACDLPRGDPIARDGRGRTGGRMTAVQWNGYRRLNRRSSSAQPEQAMPPAPDCSTALRKGPAFGAQLAWVHGSPRPPSRGSDPRRRRPAAGLPSLPRQAWTDRTTVVCQHVVRGGGGTYSLACAGRAGRSR